MCTAHGVFFENLDIDLHCHGNLGVLLPKVGEDRRVELNLEDGRAIAGSLHESIMPDPARTLVDGPWDLSKYWSYASATR